MSNRKSCKLCGKLMVPADGPAKAKAILVGEFPGFEEVKMGVPFIGSAGAILKKEMRDIGLDFKQFRVANLWGHGKPGKGSFEDEFNYHVGNLVKEFSGRQAVLLMGSDCATHLLKRSIMDISGLSVPTKWLPSEIFPSSIEVVVAAPNPAAAVHAGPGELRIALHRFKLELERMKIL